MLAGARRYVLLPVPDVLVRALPMFAYIPWEALAGTQIFQKFALITPAKFCVLRPFFARVHILVGLRMQHQARVDMRCCSCHL